MTFIKRNINDESGKTTSQWPSVSYCANKSLFHSFFTHIYCHFDFNQLKDTLNLYLKSKYFVSLTSEGAWIRRKKAAAVLLCNLRPKFVIIIIFFIIYFFLSFIFMAFFSLSHFFTCSHSTHCLDKLDEGFPGCVVKILLGLVSFNKYICV